MLLVEERRKSQGYACSTGKNEHGQKRQKTQQNLWFLSSTQRLQLFYELHLHILCLFLQPVKWFCNFYFMLHCVLIQRFIFIDSCLYICVNIQSVHLHYHWNHRGLSISIAGLGASKLMGVTVSIVFSANSVCPVLFVCKSLSFTFVLG